MLKPALAQLMLEALDAAAADGALPAAPPIEPAFERPRDVAHGDLATNMALHLARELGVAPMAIAVAIAERLRGTDSLAAAEAAAPGFVNLRLASATLEAALLATWRAGRSEIAQVPSLPGWWLDGGESLDDPAFRLRRAHVMMGVVLRAARDEGLAPSASIDLAPLHDAPGRTLLLDIALLADELAARDPARLMRHALRLAADFEAFHVTGRVFGVDRDLAIARLTLLAGARLALAGAVAPLGIALPDDLG